ncbi:hypothetical protein [Telmatospirillum sp.]|uniref:hypothetical protein n=1 Tax=Telmatospirillum sp. TaxID=2079197 RepID=UPI002850F0A4|nr:hypothetical protein [Telmatospirillum sp.]MDR3438047.1 hypothetical protein [Telmatospirillum sp.]
MRKFIAAALHAMGSLTVAAVLAGAMAAPAIAHGPGGGGWHGGGDGWHGGDRGRWHGGWGVDVMMGWPGYYDYAPYPYPYPYAYPTYVVPAPTTTIIQQAPVTIPAPAAQYYYYCDNPKGYYPYVATCQQAWRPVSATPPTP